MRNKILIFLLCVLTFGVFAIPLSFAKDYTLNDYSKVNRVNSITFNDNTNSVDFTFDYNDINESNKYWFITMIFYDDNFNLVNYNSYISSANIYYSLSEGGSIVTRTLDKNNSNFSQCLVSNPNLQDTIRVNNSLFDLKITITFSYSYYTTFKNSERYVNILAYRSDSISAPSPFLNYFVSNNYYGLSNFGFFNGVDVELGYTGTNRFTNVNNYMLGFNNISFGSLSNEVATNNSRNSNQYYLRVHFNKYINQMINLDLSYLEITGGKVSGTYYTKNQLMQVLPILSTNIVLYNDNTKLFQTDELFNSSYSSLYLEYIDFDICNYTFTTSTYYNPNLGVLGYIQNTYISAMSLSNTQAYQEGEQKGFKDGYLDGYNAGYQLGYGEKGNNFDDLFFAVGNVPMTIISSMLNFEILGFNLLGFFMGIITLLLFVRIVRKFKE